MEYANELSIALKACIQHHTIILKACKLTEQFFSPILLVKSLQVILQICNMAYAASMVHFV